MPKDNSLLEQASILEHSPVRGLSDETYQTLALRNQPVEFTKSPIGGMSLPEYLRIAGLAD